MAEYAVMTQLLYKIEAQNEEHAYELINEYSSHDVEGADVYIISEQIMEVEKA